MIGWNISVYKLADEGGAPAVFDSPQGKRLAVWQTRGRGLHWLNELVEAGRAIDLGGNGYPRRYTATAEHIVPRIIDDPPEALPIWTCDDGDIVTERWEGETVVDIEIAKQCHLNEWLLVEAWDES